METPLNMSKTRMRYKLLTINFDGTFFSTYYFILLSKHLFFKTRSLFLTMMHEDFRIQLYKKIGLLIKTMLSIPTTQKEGSTERT